MNQNKPKIKSYDKKCQKEQRSHLNSQLLVKIAITVLNQHNMFIKNCQENYTWPSSFSFDE